MESISAFLVNFRCFEVCGCLQDCASDHRNAVDLVRLRSRRGGSGTGIETTVESLPEVATIPRNQAVAGCVTVTMNALPARRPR
jgi:hypothetical protein